MTKEKKKKRPAEQIWAEVHCSETQDPSMMGDTREHLSVFEVF